MTGDEDEVWEEPSASAVLPSGRAVGGESVGTVAPLPAATASGTAADGKQPLAYWQAAISALSPEKQAAAWQFFQERELGLAKGATDTLSGLVLLLEANGLFMDACAKRLADTVTASARQDEREESGKILPVLESIPAELHGLESKVAGQTAASAAPLPALPASPSIPSGQPATSGKASRWAARGPGVWCLAALLALVAGGIGVWLGETHARAAADLQVKTQVRQIRTWLDVDEQARAILMSRKGELAFDFARDPSLGNRKVYILTIKGVPILRAGKTKEGAGVIAFDSGSPDLIP